MFIHGISKWKAKKKKNDNVLYKMISSRLNNTHFCSLSVKKKQNQMVKRAKLCNV